MTFDFPADRRRCLDLIVRAKDQPQLQETLASALTLISKTHLQVGELHRRYRNAINLAISDAEKQL